MSVVNKMLQDLEARQAKPGEVSADYQPPQKKQSKLLIVILLFLAMAAIGFALLDINNLFDKSAKAEPVIASKPNIAPPTAVEKVLMVPAAQPKAAQTSLAQPLPNKVEVLETRLDTALTDTELDDMQDPPSAQSNVAGTQVSQVSVQALEKQQPTQVDVQLSEQAVVDQPSSFSMSGSNQKDSASSLKQRIGESLDNNNQDQAQSLLYQLLKAEPTNIKARKKLASLLFAQGDYGQSKLLLSQGIQLHPAQSDLRLMLARLHMVQKDPVQAMNVLVESEPGRDNQTEYLAYRAALAQQLKQPAVAKVDYRRLTTIETSNAKWWLGLAIASDQLSETKMAVQAYRQARSLGQLDVSVHEFIQQRITLLAGAP